MSSSRKSGRGGSGAARSGSEVFPDLHHKMSKKIAQLTKVIYHLNTRNDDHEQRLSAMASQHEGEIESIMSDAAAKVRRFQDMLERRKNAAEVAEKTRQIRAQYEAEKKVRGRLRALGRATAAHARRRRLCLSCRPSSCARRRRRPRPSGSGARAPRRCGRRWRR